MSSYGKILSESIEYSYEDGQPRTLQMDILQKGADPASGAIGLVGDVIHQYGAKSNALNQVLNPAQVQFQIRDSSGLLAKLRGGQPRDFKVRLSEDGQTIFVGYVVLKSKRRTFYEDIPAVELRAFDGLKLLDGIPIEQSLDYTGTADISVKYFLQQVEQALGIELGWVVYTNYNDPASDFHFPSLYYFNLGKLMRGVSDDERTWGKALELFARDHFGMQIFQYNGRWRMVGRAERVNTPAAITRVNLVEDIVSTVDMTGPTLDKSNALRNPDGDVIGAIGGVDQTIYLGDGGVRNGELDFVGSDIPFWDFNDVSDVRAFKELRDSTASLEESNERAVEFDSLGQSSIRQIGRSVLHSTGQVYEDQPRGSTETYYVWGAKSRAVVEISISLQVIADSSGYTNTENWSQLDMFKLELVDPYSDLGDPVTSNIDIVGVQVGLGNGESRALGYSGLNNLGTWFQTRLEGDGALGRVMNIEKTYTVELDIFNEEYPYDPNQSDLGDTFDKYRYIRPVVKPKPSDDQLGGDGSKIERVLIKSFSMKAKSGDVYNQRNDTLRSPEAQGEIVERTGYLTTPSDKNTQFVFKARQSGTIKNVNGLAYNGRKVPEAAPYDRLAMNAVDLERVNLRCRALAGTSPLQALPFDTGDGTIHILPVLWKRAILSGQVTISGIEARYDEGDITTKTTYGSEDQAASGGGYGGGISSGGSAGTGGGSGITDHGQLDGLADDDHKQYLNNARGDARYVKPNTTPVFDQVVLNNPASADNHALRAGQVLQTTAPITGGGKLRDGLNVRLTYNAVNLKVGAQGLDTIQPIHKNADMELKSLLIKEGITLDELASFIQSQVFVGDFAGEGFQLKKDAQGKWQLTVDDLVIRNSAKIYEILVTQLQAFAAFLLTEGHKVEEVEQVGDASWSWNDTINVFADGATNPEGLPYTYADHYKCYIPEDKLLQLAIDDLLLRQDFDGRNVGSNEATIIDVEQGDVVPTDNTPRRSFTVYLEDNSAAPLAGWQFARSGNRTDTNRQGGIYFVGTGADAPYQRMYDGVDRHSKFGSMETIISQNGNLDGLVLPEFAELDGTQNNLYGQVIRNIYASGVINVTGGNAATKAYVDDQTGTSVTTIIASSAPTERNSGSALQQGDTWLDSSDGLRPYSWDGSNWIREYTTIDGGDVVTGRVGANFVQVGSQTDFDSNYDPSTKETPSGAQSKVNSLQGDLDGLFDDAIMNGTTIIANGYLKSVIVKATLIEATKLSSVSSSTGSLTVDDEIIISTSGVLKNATNDYKIDDSGFSLRAGGTIASVINGRKIIWNHQADLSKRVVEIFGVNTDGSAPYDDEDSTLQINVGNGNGLVSFSAHIYHGGNVHTQGNTEIIGDLNAHGRFIGTTQTQTLFDNNPQIISQTFECSTLKITASTGSDQIGYIDGQDGQFLLLLNKSGRTITLVDKSAVFGGNFQIGSNYGLVTDRWALLYNDNGNWSVQNDRG